MQPEQGGNRTGPSLRFELEDLSRETVAAVAGNPALGMGMKPMPEGKGI
jgi:hypothetical protein